MDALTTTEVAALGGFIGVLFASLLLWYILIIIGGWKVLTKAGEKGWKILIPIYNVYILFKIVGMKKWFWATFVGSICVSIINGILGTVDGDGAAIVASILSLCFGLFSLFVDIYWCVRLSKAFHHGLGYAIGLIFLQNIFILILGFGKSKYDKKILNA